MKFNIKFSFHLKDSHHIITSVKGIYSLNTYRQSQNRERDFHVQVSFPFHLRNSHHIHISVMSIYIDCFNLKTVISQWFSCTNINFSSTLGTVCHYIDTPVMSIFTDSTLDSVFTLMNWFFILKTMVLMLNIMIMYIPSWIKVIFAHYVHHLWLY